MPIFAEIILNHSLSTHITTVISSTVHMKSMQLLCFISDKELQKNKIYVILIKKYIYNAIKLHYLIHPFNIQSNNKELENTI